MTDAYGLPSSGRPEWYRIGARWGHAAPQLLSGAIVAVIALGIRTTPPTLLTTMAGVGLLTFVLLTWLQLRQHDRRLCETCVMSLPLNAAEHAARLRRRFWVAHAGSNPWLLVPYLAVLIGSNFLLSPAGRMVWALVQASMIYLLLSYTSHRRLQPWCPWCSGGGGGADDEVGDPELPRGDRRQLV